MFIGQHLFLGPLRAFPLLPPDLLDPLPFFARFSEDQGFDLVGQDPPRQKPVDGLRPLFLAFDRDAGRDMLQINTRLDFVDVLPALPLRPDEFFNEIAIADAQLLHLLLEGIFFFGADAEESHDMDSYNIFDLIGQFL